MKFQFASLIFALLLFPLSAFADYNPDRVTSRGNCSVFTMCSVQTATGDCTESPAAGDERVVNAMGFNSLTFWGLVSIGAFSCDVMSNTVGHDAASGVGHQINLASITDAAPFLTIKGNVGHVWVNCSSIATSVTIALQACTD